MSRHRNRFRRVVVTGAAGFIGSHLSERLAAEGYHVIGIDRLCGSFARPDHGANLAGLARDPMFTLIESDLSEIIPTRSLRGASAVFHLAARPGVRGQDVGPYLTDNIRATARLLDAVAESGVPDVIFASSSSVYETVRNSSHPSREDDAVAPVSIYGRTKAIGERMCRCAAVRSRIARLFSVYGPRQRCDMAFARFIRAALDGVPAPLYQPEHDVARDFTYVEDAIEGMLLCWLRGRGDAVYNIGNGVPIRLASARTLLASILGRAIPCERMVAPALEARCTHADLTRARGELGYAPLVELADGLRAQVRAAIGSADVIDGTTASELPRI